MSKICDERRSGDEIFNEAFNDAIEKQNTLIEDLIVDMEKLKEDNDLLVEKKNEQN